MLATMRLKTGYACNIKSPWGFSVNALRFLEGKVLMSVAGLSTVARSIVLSAFDIEIPPNPSFMY